MMKKIAWIFVWAFALNAVWENLHSVLYAGYKGGEITEFILMRAAGGDALIIVLMSLPFLFVAGLRSRSWLIIPLGVVIGIGIELYALSAGRWAYNAYMPIVPLLGVGLTPMIQLGLLGYLSYQFASRD